MSKQKGIRQAIADFGNLRRDVAGLERDLPKIVGNSSIEWIHRNFEHQAYEGQKWQPRSPATNASYDRRSGVKGSVYNSSNPLLKQSGNLYDGIRYNINGKLIFVGFDTNKLPYGRIHNEGGVIQKTGSYRTIYHSGGKFSKKGTGTGQNVVIKAHEIKEPARQFMPKPSEPENRSLMEFIGQKIKTRRDRIFRKFVR